MPIFLDTIVTPKGTTLAAPHNQALIAIPGSLSLVRFHVPPGPRGELYLRLLWGGVQILPARAGTWFRPDNVTLEYTLRPGLIIGPGAVLFYMQGASPRANYPHTVDFELHIDSGQSVLSFSDLTDATLQNRLQDL